MSKVILVCSRDSREGPKFRKLLECIHTELIPDNIDPCTSRVFQNGNAQIAVINPVSLLSVHDGSVLTGHMAGKSENWWKPGAPAPDGSYGLFRLHENIIELVTDSVASRTIWYCLTDDIFVASTSQRAIIMLLGSYESNADAAVWMLSSGCLGPGNSWDSRLSYVEPDSTVMFDCQSWSIKIRSKPIAFVASTLPDIELSKTLAGMVRDVLAKIDIDFSKTALPLSGGFDSRALLMMLKDRGLNRCITWGRAASQNDTRNDAYLAKRVATHFGAEHRYFVTDPDTSNETIDNIFRRFLIAGEGRVARISGYTDGLAVWKTLFEQNIEGVIRGDQLFGGDPVAEEFDVRKDARLTVFADYENLPDAASLDLPSQCISDQLLRNPDETLDTWRERTYEAYTVPVMMAGLTELKSSYVEVINPLLSRSIVEYCRILPDSLRTYNKFWHEFVLARSPDIPIAETAAPTPLHIFLRKKEVVDVIFGELESLDRPSIISSKLVRLISTGVEVSAEQAVKRNRLKRAISPLVPPSVRFLAHRFRKNNSLDINILAFRAFMVCKMCRMLHRDAAWQQQV